MTPSANPFIALIDLFRSPAECLAGVFQRPKWGWFAWLFIILSPFMFWGYYFDLVNQTWLFNNIVAQNPFFADGENTEWLTIDLLLTSEVIKDIVGRTAVILFMALWFTLATREQENKLGFLRWLGVSCFIFLPMVIGDVASYVNVLFNYGQVMPNTADLNSLNGLLKLPMNHPWASFAETIPLLMPWYVALSYIALSMTTSFQRGHAMSVALLPWLGLLIIWPISIVLF
ncbi:YIP1 family protein [Thaumasiovibrio subtropicus]|uniref:YIP1 family protein n=1 Tax=Thaumasiovibrio subtropicus TaxID=1891207 RepID=UPI000B359170|nr:YIP1 family protein [Thaumasiovibrio subtropicus]